MAFIFGISGTAGRQVRFVMPSTAENALRIAVIVSQAEIREVRNNAFYLQSEVADISPAGRIREPAVRHTGAKPAAVNGENRRKPSQAGQRPPTSELPQAMRSREILCSVTNAVTTATMRVIAQIGHNGGLTAK